MGKYIITEEEKSRILNMHKLRYKNNLLPISLNEQTTMPIDRIQTLIDNDKTNKASLLTSAKQGSCVFIKSPVFQKEKIDLGSLSAQFYNNMVSLEKGLMDNTPLSNVQQQITKIIEKINTEQLKNVQIQIIGTATSSSASDKPDPRLLQIDPSAKLDHPGGNPYGGEKANNKYLAQQRANSIQSLFQKLLPTAKYTTTTEIIEGGSTADDKRYIKLNITGDKETRDIKIFSDIYLNWTVSYTPSKGTSNEQGLKKATANTGMDSAYDVNTNPVDGYVASIKIVFGQKSNPQFNGEFVALSLDKIPELDQQSQSYILQNPNRMTNARYKWVQKVPTKTSQTGPFLGTFLQSCGYLTRDVANNLDEYKPGTMLDVTGEIFKKLAQKGAGNLQDFMQIVGGNSKQTLTPEYTFGAKVYDVTVNPPTLTNIK